MESTEIPAAADTCLHSGEPETSFGANSSIDIEAWAGEPTLRGLVRFDLSDGIPRDATVTEAWLDLMGGATDLAGTIGVYRVTRAWDEDFATWSLAEKDQPWTEEGGDFEPETLATLKVSKNQSANPVTWTMLLEVSRCLSGEVENHGWLLKDADEASIDAQRCYIFASRSSSNFSSRPKLRLRFCRNCELCL